MPFSMMPNLCNIPLWKTPIFYDVSKQNARFLWCLSTKCRFSLLSKTSEIPCSPKSPLFQRQTRTNLHGRPPILSGRPFSSRPSSEVVLPSPDCPPTRKTYCPFRPRLPASPPFFSLQGDPPARRSFLARRPSSLPSLTERLTPSTAKRLVTNTEIPFKKRHRDTYATPSIILGYYTFLIKSTLREKKILIIHRYCI